MLPADPDLRLGYPGEGDRYPVVILLGTEHRVGVQVRRGYIHPRFLRRYENAYVIIPYLRHPVLKGYCYTFSRIYVSDQRVVEDGARLNRSPKVYATIENMPGRFVVNFQGQSRIDVTFRDAPANATTSKAPATDKRPHATKAIAAATATSGKSDSALVAGFLRAVFKQPKIEFSPRPHVFDFDFMAGAEVQPVLVSGKVSLQPVAASPAGTAAAPGDISAVSAGQSVPAVRFSAHWTKTLEF